MPLARRMRVLAIVAGVLAALALLALVTGPSREAAADARCRADDGPMLCGFGEGLITAIGTILVGPALGTALVAAWIARRAQQGLRVPDWKHALLIGAALFLVHEVAAHLDEREFQAALAACGDGDDWKCVGASTPNRDLYAVFIYGSQQAGGALAILALVRGRARQPLA